MLSVHSGLHLAILRKFRCVQVFRERVVYTMPTWHSASPGRSGGGARTSQQAQETCIGESELLSL